MKRDKRETEFATEEQIKQSTIKKNNGRIRHTRTPDPQSKEDLILDEKKGKSTSL